MVGTLIRRPPVVSDFMRTLLDDATATDALTTLGIGPIGSYTPGLNNTTNVAASTASISTYLRIGTAVVIVWGEVAIDPTTASVATLLGMAIPVVSDFTTIVQAAGVFSAGGVNQTGAILADVTNNRVSFSLLPALNSNVSYRFIFAYQVV